MALARRTIRNTAILFAARTGSRLLVFVVFLVQQRALGPTGYGEFATITVLSNLASISADLGLQIVYLREGSRHRERLDRLLATVLAAKLPLLAASLVVLWVMVSVGGPPLPQLLWPAFALLLTTSVANVLRSTFYATGEIRYEAIATGAEAVILLGGTAAIAALGFGLPAYLLVYAASYGFTCVFAAIVIRRRYFRIRLLPEVGEAGRLLRLGLPFALAFALNTIYFKIDILILDGLRGYHQVGIYQAAYKFLEGLSFIPQTIMNAIFPALAIVHLEGRGRLRSLYTSAYRLLATIAVPLAVAFGLDGGAILRVVGVYSQSATAARILALALLFLFVNNSFIFGLGAMDRQLASVWLAGFSILVNVVLNLVLIPLFPRDAGYLASSWATVVTEVFLLAAGYLVVRRHLGSLPWLRPSWPIAGAGLVMAAVVVELSSGSVLWVLPVGGVAYLAVLVGLGGISRDEWRLARSSLGRGGGLAPAGAAEGPGATGSGSGPTRPVPWRPRPPGPRPPGPRPPGPRPPRSPVG
ncbi:MAG TPA: oligosaccharide flippase family protein [Candidatus Micrarchaeia archaeon]|nr:oligosaccharide flippase family protein [Candidatus Micrarchaeia archaeon]